MAEDLHTRELSITRDAALPLLTDENIAPDVVAALRGEASTFEPYGTNS